MQANMTFPNASNSFDAMLEAFFCVQPNEHIKAWKWHLYTKNSNMDAVDAALAKASAELRSARYG
jgi:hypothetical protein